MWSCLHALWGPCPLTLHPGLPAPALRGLLPVSCAPSQLLGLPRCRCGCRLAHSALCRRTEPCQTGATGKRKSLDECEVVLPPTLDY